jgi:predicted ester cyclase
MSLQQNRSIVQSFYDCYQNEDWTGARRLCSDDYRFYHNIDTPMTAAEYFPHEEENFRAIPGFTISVAEMVAEGDKVAAYLVIERQASPKLRFSLLNLLTLADGKIVQKRAHYDMRDILQQLNPAA